MGWGSLGLGLDVNAGRSLCADACVHNDTPLLVACHRLIPETRPWTLTGNRNGNRAAEYEIPTHRAGHSILLTVCSIFEAETQKSKVLAASERRVAQ